MPVGAVGKLVRGECSRDFSLISELAEVLCSMFTFNIVQEATHIFGSNIVGVVRGAEGRRTIVRNVDSDLDSLGRLTGASPKGSSAGADGFKLAIRCIR